VCVLKLGGVEAPPSTAVARGAHAAPGRPPSSACAAEVLGPSAVGVVLLCAFSGDIYLE
jgi:hypothetical protein